MTDTDELVDYSSGMPADKEKPEWVGHRDVWTDDHTEILSDLRMLSTQWRAAQTEANRFRTEMHRTIVEAKEAGHSFSQLREVTGLGTGTLQMVLAKAGKLSPQTEGDS